MPFEPLTPDEEKEFAPPCRSREHDPPSHMVITRPMKWVCPSCGMSVVLRPATTYCATGEWLAGPVCFDSASGQGVLELRGFNV
jgi:hypothetical protein